MAKEEKKAPKLRFNGYTNDWERKKLGIYVPITMGQSPNSKNYTSNPRDNILVQGNADLYNNRVLKRTFTTEVTKTADKDDILMSVRAPVGDIARNQYESIVIGRGIAAIKGNNFLYYQLEKMNNSGFWKKYIAGSTFESINGKDLKSSDIYISNYKEEKSIGNIFQTLTKTIQLHERKCEELALIKQALLQKLFPKKDEVIPEVRYKSFSAAWEQRKLGEYANYRRGSFPQPYGKKEWYGGHSAMPFVQVVDVDDNLKLVNNTKQKISKLAQPKSVFVPAGKVIVTLQGSIGRVAVTQYPAYADRTIMIFENYKFPTYEYFWAYVIKQKFEIEKLKAPGGTIKTITKEALSNFKVFMPVYEEQKKVGDFFQQLDSLIALHQRKLEKLKQLKKFLLQNMFI